VPHTGARRFQVGHNRRAAERVALAAAICCRAPLVLTACSPASAHTATPATASPVALPSCQAPSPTGLPRTAGSLTQGDTGDYCHGVGKAPDIFLTAPSGMIASGGRWSEIKITDTSVLGYGDNGVMTTMLGETPGVVIGRARGATTLTGALPDGTKWTATIVVG
jgi:hypothetical protein